MKVCSLIFIFWNDFFFFFKLCSYWFFSPQLKTKLSMNTLPLPAIKKRCRKRESIHASAIWSNAHPAARLSVSMRVTSERLKLNSCHVKQDALRRHWFHLFIWLWEAQRKVPWFNKQCFLLWVLYLFHQSCESVFLLSGNLCSKEGIIGKFCLCIKEIISSSAADELPAVLMLPFITNSDWKQRRSPLFSSVWVGLSFEPW